MNNVDITDEEFTGYVEEAVASLPDEFRYKLSNVAVLVEESPTREQMRKTGTYGYGLLLGLYEGIPQLVRGNNYGGVLPDRITIFKSSILQISHTKEEVIAQIYDTVLHEIGHHFGMTESEIHEAGKKRKLRI